MKINNTDGIVKQMYPPKVDKKGKTADHQFKQILTKTLAASCADNSILQGHAISASAARMKLQPLSGIGPENDSLIRRVDRLLDLLDEYRHRLGDPQVSLKEISPLVNRLDVENANLKPVWESLPDGDEMKEILNAVRVNASLAVIKFKRGDYVPT